MEMWVDLVKFWSRVPALVEDSPTINVMQEGVELVGLIREATVIQEHIFLFARISFQFRRDVDGGLGFGDVQCSESRQDIGSKDMQA